MLKQLYLLIISAVFALPFLASFGPRFFFVKYWRGVFFGIGVMMLLFIPLEMWLASKEIIGWNTNFISGMRIGNLPLDELFYLIAVPFAFCYLYQRLDIIISFKPPAHLVNKLTALIIFSSFVFSIVFVDRMYTFTTCSILALFLIWHLFILKADYLGKFYLTFVLFQFPYFLLKCGLTGMFTTQSVLWYNSTELTGFKLLTVPVDTLAFEMLMFLIVITAFEALKIRQFSGALNVS